MKLLLYSDFGHMPINEVQNMLGKKSNLTCLFCSYADEDAPSYTNRVKQNLSKIFDKIIDLTPEFTFDTPIDCVFINGGYNYELSYKLKKYNQFDKIIELVKSGVLYIGNSAGSVMVGSDFEFTLSYEPPRFSMDTDSNKYGFNFINKHIIVHTSKYIFSDRKNMLIYKKQDYPRRLKLRRILKDYITIGNNEVVCYDNGKIISKKYPWKAVLKLFQK